MRFNAAELLREPISQEYTGEDDVQAMLRSTLPWIFTHREPEVVPAFIGGQWEVYRTDKHYIPYFIKEKRTPPLFAAAGLYYTFGSLRTVFYGKAASKETLEDTVEILIEQMPSLSSPIGRGIRNGALTALATMWSIPVTHLLGAGAFYNRILSLINSYMLFELNAVNIGAIAGVVTMGISLKISDVNDRRLSKELSPEDGFSYGSDAVDSIKEDAAAIHHEIIKEGLYRKLKRVEQAPPEEYFDQLWDNVKASDMAPADAIRYYTSHTLPRGINLSKMINALTIGQ